MLHAEQAFVRMDVWGQAGPRPPPRLISPNNKEDPGSDRAINQSTSIRGANLANAWQAEARGTSDTAKHVPVASSARGLPATLCVSSILHLLY